MTTQTWTTVVDHSSDAGFRAWGAELQTKFLAAGLVQTADTGQINWTTVVRAAANNDAGYEVYHLPGTLFGTSPVYIRFTYSTGSSATVPMIYIDVGSATNGAGVIAGTAGSTKLPASTNITIGGAPFSTSTTYSSWLSVSEGFFGLVWKSGATGTANLGFGGCMLSRPVDATGALVGDGLYFQRLTAAFSTLGQAYHLMFTPSQRLCVVATPSGFVPVSDTTLLVGTDVQYFTFFMFGATPRPLISLLGLLHADVTEGTTFSATPIGSTSHTYLVVDREFGGSCSNPNTFTANLGLAMLWE